MTNYTKCPYWRCNTGFTIKFSEDSYSWCDDTVNQRKYLATSNYIDGSQSVFIGKLNKWMEKEEFRTFCIEDNYKKIIKESLKEVNKKEDRFCSQCNGKLKLINGKFGPFIGCSNYPNCKFTEKIKINYQY